ncbi:unnamed protein product [Albugo candida]|uniref:Uncharacterized protein n=1 Tax=Albugo candida TaxID=65357 RepID=A0A024GU27_9STRA|nr:unnamed protein product [Albugo candida]|eukprot:CCI50241.1 unnamed protein product [Albugo candida]
MERVSGCVEILVEVHALHVTCKYFDCIERHRRDYCRQIASVCTQECLTLDRVLTSHSKQNTLLCFHFNCSCAASPFSRQRRLSQSHHQTASVRRDNIIESITLYKSRSVV